MKSLGFALVLLGMLSVGCAEVSNVKCKLDLGLVVDKTRSIKKSNIPQVKEALQHLMQRFDISADKSHVSFLTFTEKSTLHNAFNNPTYHSQDAILALISSSLKKLRSPTRLDKAIKTAKDKMFTSENGLRPGVGRAMVLYTDGRSHPDSEEIHRDVAALKVKGVRIAVVGIGPLAKKTQYRKVLEDVGGENVFFVDDYNSLDDHTNDIMKIVCGVSTPSTVSSTSSSCNSCTTSSSVTPSSSLCHSCTTSSSVTTSSSLCHSCATSSSVTTSSSESTSSSVSPSIFTLSSENTSSSVSPSIIIHIFTDIFPWRRSSSATSSSSESTSSSVSPSVIIDIFTSSSSSSSSTASTSSSSSSTASTSESTSSSVSPSVINDIFTSSSSSSSSTASTSESTSSSVSPSVIIDIFTSSSSVTSSTASTSSASSSTASASVAAR